jgi:hypothetical protein
MKRKLFIFSFTIITLLSTSAFIIKSSGGIAGFTNSPGEANCGACHGGGTSTSFGTTITSTPVFSSSTFSPGVTYTIAVNVAATGFNRFGFGCEVLDENGNNVGNMQNPKTGVSIVNAGNGRKNAIQNAPKLGSGAASFLFEWVAPFSDTATIYAAANAINVNGSTTGDFPLPAVFLQLKTNNPTTVSIKEVNTNALSQISVYPNPAKQLTTISYDLKETKKVTIQLIDLNGKLVKNFISDTENSGSHTHLLDLNNISSELYFVRLLLDNKKITQKLIIVQE